MSTVNPCFGIAFFQVYNIERPCQTRGWEIMFLLLNGKFSVPLLVGAWRKRKRIELSQAMEKKNIQKTPNMNKEGNKRKSPSKTVISVYIYINI